MAGIHVLRRWFSGERHAQDTRRPQVKIDDTYQSIEDDQPMNPYTEALLLHGHTRSILNISLTDNKRFVTMSEDNLVILWDAETGHRLQVMEGHTAAVTCALSLRLSSEKGLLLTGSMDCSLKLWSLNYDETMPEGPCVRTITEHEGPVLCLTQLSHNLVCSGGRDLCIWDRNGNLLDKFDRSSLSDKSDVHSVLRLDTNHISVVAASDYKCLAVYDIERAPMTDRGYYKLKRDQKRRYLTQSHNHPVTFLTSISASFFASGCRGGTIIVWSVQHLNGMKIFYCLPQPQTRELTVEFSRVSTIHIVNERYVFAAVGCGFRMYDVLGQEKDSQNHPKPLVSHTCAHLRPLTSLTFLEDRSMLVTVAEDRMIRLWGNANRQKKRENDPSGHTSRSASIDSFIGGGIPVGGSTSRKMTTVVPLLLGELHLHDAIVMVLQSVDDYGVITGGEDGSLILWKDGDHERELCDREMQAYILGQLPD